MNIDPTVLKAQVSIKVKTRPVKVPKAELSEFISNFELDSDERTLLDLFFNRRLPRSRKEKSLARQLDRFKKNGKGTFFIDHEVI